MVGGSGNERRSKVGSSAAGYRSSSGALASATVAEFATPSLASVRLAAITRLSVRAIEAGNLSDYLHDATAQIRAALAADSCVVFELRPSAQALSVVAASSTRGITDDVPIDASPHSHAHYAMHCPRPTVVGDATSERRFAIASWLSRNGFGSAMWSAIEGGDTPYGILGIHFHEPHTFTPDDEEFLQAAATLIRAAVHNHPRQRELRRLHATVYHAPVGIADRSLDGRWLRVNDRLCKIVGYSRGDLLAMNVDAMIHPNDKKRAHTQLQAQRLGKSDLYSLDLRVLRKDGSYVWVTLSSSLIRTPTGDPGYSVVVVDDATARKSIEGDLRESQERFRQVLYCSPVPMMIYDQDGHILGISRSLTTLTGYTPEDLPTTEAWSRAVFRERADEIAAAAPRVWAEPERERHYELDIFTKTGERKTLQFSTAHLGTNRSGRHLRVAAAADVTQQRRFERQLLEANKQKDDFIAMLAHELRNPLAAISNVTTLIGELHHDERTQRLHAILQRQSKHMGRLLYSLLDISRVVQGKITIEKSIVDFCEIVREVSEDLISRHQQPGIEFHTDIPRECVWIDADPVRMTQVVENLLSNAIKYTSAPGKIHLRLKRNAHEAVLTVEDTGEGIEPALLPNLFEPFRQGQQTLARSQGGLGLGLALVRSLVDLHDGRVSAQSGGSGLGSTFEVTLPLAETPTVTPTRARATSIPRRILVIEDNADIAESLREVLEQDGHTVYVAAAGEPGIEIARSTPLDIVLCDLGLPGGVTGFDVAMRLRAERSTCDLYLVALTGYGQRDDRRRSQAAGFDVHVTKPIDPDDLEQVLAAIPERGNQA